VATSLLSLRLPSMLAAAAGLPGLRLPRMTAATTRLACLLGVATATTAVVLGSSVAASISLTVAAAMRTGGCGRADRQGGHSSGQNKPGHDKTPFVSGFQRRCGKARSCDQVRFICDEPHFSALA
jgi:hypothetical protein